MSYTVTGGILKFSDSFGVDQILTRASRDQDKYEPCYLYGTYKIRCVPLGDLSL